MIAGMLRIKNEERWIARVLESMLPVCRQIFIFDDSSTDETRNICRKFPAVTLFESPFAEGVNETRDKNWLLDRVEAQVPEGSWVVHIDGDEEIAPGGCDFIKSLATSRSIPDAYQFHVLYLWETDKQIRVDGIYRNFYRSSMFRLNRGARFTSGVAGGFHCGNAPKPVQQAARCGVQLLHYGYMLKDDRVRKWDFYNSIDPMNRAEGYEPAHPERRSYPHMVQGDVPQVPRNAKLVHAGPLELRPL